MWYDWIQRQLPLLCKGNKKSRKPIHEKIVSNDILFYYDIKPGGYNHKIKKNKFSHVKKQNVFIFQKNRNKIINVGEQFQ